MGQGQSTASVFSYKMGMSISFPPKSLLTERQDTVSLICPNLRSLLENRVLNESSLLYRIFRDPAFTGYNMRNIYIINKDCQILIRVVCTDFTHDSIMAINADNLTEYMVPTPAQVI